MLDKLRELNKKIIETSTNEEEIKKQKLIKNILDDDKCFFKMNIKYAYAILQDLGIKKEDIENVYKELISIKNM